MGVLARLSGTVVDVEPGGRAVLDLSVRNTGTVVDQFSFEVLGTAAAWTTVEPASVSLFPQAEETVQVIFAPPRAPATAAGSVPFGIRVMSREDPQGSAVEEGTLNVAPFSDVVAELAPRAVRVRRRGRLQVLVDNRSNVGYRAELVGTDGDEAFEYGFRPPLVEVGAGAVSFAKLTVRAKQRYWRGPATTQVFQVLLRQPQVAGPDGEPLEPTGPHPAEVPADGAILRDPILPAWLAKAVILALLLILLLALAWFKLVKPQITAAAQNSVTKAIKPLTKEVGQLKNRVAQLPPSPPSPGGPTTTTTAPAVTTTTTSKSHPTTTTTTKPHPTTTTTRPKPRPVVVVVPVNASLAVAGNNTTAVYNIPRHHTLEVTDILLENSAGVSGNIYLARSGDVLMSWSLANFRDLDYHWITPIYFDAGSQLQLSVRDCAGTCTPSLYFAGNLTSAP
jgi:hypothetical protein